MGKLDAAGEAFTSVEVIAEEARKIDVAFRGGKIPQDGARGGRDLRLHVGGDVGSAEGAKLLGAAATRWKERGGGSTWTFTHNWREVPRSAWGKDISVLASVETAGDITMAMNAGYAAAIVVEEFPEGDKAFKLPGSRASIVPCPAETRGRTCAECRLCLDRDLLKTKTAIAFALHGQRIKQARQALGDAQEVRRPRKGP